MPSLQQRHLKHLAKVSRPKDLALVHLPLVLHWNMLLHPLLHRLLQRHRNSVHRLPHSKKQSVGQLLLKMIEVNKFYI